MLESKINEARNRFSDVAKALTTGPTAIQGVGDALWIESQVYTGVVLYDWRRGESVDLEAIDQMPPDAIAYNRRCGIDADLHEYEGDKSVLKASTRVRFYYDQQGAGADANIAYSVLGLLASQTDDFVSLAEQVKSFQKGEQDARARWCEPCRVLHGGIRDPYKHGTASLRRFFEGLQ